jgi:hypothetical protein
MEEEEDSDDFDEEEEQDNAEDYDEEEDYSEELGSFSTQVDGEFRTKGLTQWLAKFNENKSSTPSIANLLILITRAPFSEFWASKDGKKLATALDPEPSIAMQSTSAAVIAFEYGKSKLGRWPEILEQLKPRVLEDFALLAIGLEVAAKHPKLSPLADWAKKRLPPPVSAPRKSGPRVLKPIQN